MLRVDFRTSFGVWEKKKSDEELAKLKRVVKELKSKKDQSQVTDLMVSEHVDMRTSFMGQLIEFFNSLLSSDSEAADAAATDNSVVSTLIDHLSTESALYSIVLPKTNNKVASKEGYRGGYRYPFKSAKETERRMRSKRKGVVLGIFHVFLSEFL